jgi:uncharacterized membrane protein YhaH (DUF805 family)
MNSQLVPLLFSFKGRVTRTVFWIFQICWIVLFAVVNALTQAVSSSGAVSVLSLVGLLFLFATFWPLFAIQVKRWHDRNKSGWWCFIGLVPIIGGVWTLIECGILPSVDEGNRFNA